MEGHWERVLFIILVLGSYESSASDVIGLHFIIRISEMITVTECQLLYHSISKPNEPVKAITDSAGQILLLRSQAIVTKEQCTDMLMGWFKNQTDSDDLDHFIDGLYIIGRKDIIEEIEKKKYQDEVLEMKNINEIEERELKRPHAFPPLKEKIEYNDVTRMERNLENDEMNDQLPITSPLEGFKYIAYGMLITFIGLIFVYFLIYFVNKRMEKGNLFHNEITGENNIEIP